MYKRNCPSCGVEIFHTSERHMITSEKLKKNCRKCANKIPWNKGMIGVAPWNKGLKGVQISNKKGKKYEDIYGEEKSNEIKNSLKISLTGRKLTEEHKQNISVSEKGREITWGDKIGESLKGKKLSDEHIQKLKDNHIGMKGKKHSVDTILKMKEGKMNEKNPMFGKKISDSNRLKKRIKSIFNIENRCGQVMPNYNPNGCKYLNELMTKTNSYIQHAENGGEYQIKEMGYFLDGYDIENNIVYEWDEKHHFDSFGNLKEKDTFRQTQIENYLKCKFIRIKENLII